MLKFGGERLRAEQNAADDARQNVLWGGLQVYKAQQEAKRHFERTGNTAWLTNWGRLDLQRLGYEEQMKRWDEYKAKRGQDIERVGMVNKAMQKHMLRSFAPLPNPARKKAATARRKAQQSLKKVDARALNKETAARTKRAGTRKSPGVARKRAARGRGKRE